MLIHSKIVYQNQIQFYYQNMQQKRIRILINLNLKEVNFGSLNQKQSLNTILPLYYKTLILKTMIVNIVNKSRQVFNNLQIINSISNLLIYNHNYSYSTTNGNSLNHVNKALFSQSYKLYGTHQKRFFSTANNKPQTIKQGQKIQQSDNFDNKQTKNSQLKQKLQKIRIEKGQNSYEYLQALHKVSVMLAVKNHFQQARQINLLVIQKFNEYYKSSKKTPKDDRMRLLLYKNLQKNYLSTKKLHNFIQTTNKIVSLLLQLQKKYKNFYPLLINQYKSLAQAYNDVQNYDKSIQYFRKVLQMAYNQNKIPKNRQFIVTTNNNLAKVLYKNKLQLDQAMSIYIKNIDLINQMSKQKVQDPNLQQMIQQFNINPKFYLLLLSESLLNLAQILTLNKSSLPKQQLNSLLTKIMKEVNKQLKFYHIDKKKQMKQVHQFYMNMGNLFDFANDYQKALQNFMIQRQILNDNDYQNLSQCYKNQSNIYKKTKKLQKSILKMIQAYTIRQKLEKQLTSKSQKLSAEDIIRLKQNHIKKVELCKQISDLFKMVNDEDNSKMWQEQGEILIKKQKQMQILKSQSQSKN